MPGAFIILVFISFTVFSSGQTLTNPTELTALCALAENFRPSPVVNPNEWRCVGNTPLLNPCQFGWQGIECATDVSGVYVSRVDLLATNLNGTIPSEIGLFRNLQYLDLGLNNLFGTVPDSIGNLTSLQFLGLDDNNLVGTFPSGLSKLTLLTALIINGNNFTGCLPNMENLTFLADPMLNPSTGRLDYQCVISPAPLPGSSQTSSFDCPSVSNGCPQSPNHLKLFQLPGAKCVFDCNCTWTSWSSFGNCSRSSGSCAGIRTRTRSVDQYLLGCPIISAVGIPVFGNPPCDLNCTGSPIDMSNASCLNVFDGQTCAGSSGNGTCIASNCVSTRLRLQDQIALCALARSITRPVSATPDQWSCLGNTPITDPCGNSTWFGVICLSDGNSTWIDAMYY